MKFDLIKNSNHELNTNENTSLNESEIALINFMNNQDLPELDGLNIEKVYISDKDNDKKRKLTISASNYKKELFTIVITNHKLTITGVIGNFKLTLETNYKNELITYSCNYIYGEDVISFEKKIDSLNKSFETVTASFYLNVNVDRYSLPISDGLPLDAIPNYTQVFKKYPNGCYDFSTNIPSMSDLDIETNPYEVITRWRQICKTSCDLYRQFRYESISPKTR